MKLYSHSQLSTFEQCQLKFKFKYIDKLEPDIKNTIESFLGKKVHEVLEWLYIEVSEGKLPELDLVIKNYVEFWNKDYNSDIKIIKEENGKDHYLNKGLRFLINYYTKNYPFNDNTIETEKKIFINLDKEKNYSLIGFIDRLTYDKTSNIFEIHDYKTTSSMKSQEEMNKDRQLALYSMGIKELFGKNSKVNLVWHFLDFNEKITSQRTDEELEKLKEDIKKLIEKIETTYDFKPHPSILCNWCEFQSYCPVKNKRNFRKTQKELNF